MPRRPRRSAVTPSFGDADDAGAVHLADLGQALAPETLREGADGVDARALRDAGAVQDVLRHGGAVVHGLGVRHAGKRREAARERGRHAGLDGLLVLVAGLAQVDVHVDQAGQHEEPARVEHRRVAGLERPRRAGRGDPLSVQQHVARRRPARDRIDHRAAGHEEAAHARPPVRRRSGSSAGSASPALASSALLRATSR